MNSSQNVVRFDALKKSQIPPKVVAPKLTDLSIVRQLKEGRKRMCGYNYWAVQPTGQYGNDCTTGKKFAYEYLEFLAKGPAFPLQWILEDMRKQCHNGIEVGFLGTVTRVAALGAHVAGDRLREIL
jgi:hypothetical protein